MIHNQSPQPIQQIDPQLPIPNSPEFSIDPTNPLAWVILLTLLVSSTGKTINAMAELTRAITALWLAIAKSRRTAPKQDDASRSLKQDQSIS